MPPDDARLEDARAWLARAELDPGRRTWSWARPVAPPPTCACLPSQRVRLLGGCAAGLMLPWRPDRLSPAARRAESGRDGSGCRTGTPTSTCHLTARRPTCTSTTPPSAGAGWSRRGSGARGRCRTSAWLGPGTTAGTATATATGTATRPRMATGAGTAATGAAGAGTTRRPGATYPAPPPRCGYAPSPRAPTPRYQDAGYGAPPRSGYGAPPRAVPAPPPRSGYAAPPRASYVGPAPGGFAPRGAVAAPHGGVAAPRGGGREATPEAGAAEACSFGFGGARRP